MQVWQCPACKREYVSPLRASAIRCSGSHLKAVDMVLVSGPEPRPIVSIWKEKHKAKPAAPAPTKRGPGRPKKEK